jgi:hypothetical protein
VETDSRNLGGMRGCWNSLFNYSHTKMFRLGKAEVLVTPPMRPGLVQAKTRMQMDKEKKRRSVKRKERSKKKGKERRGC